MALQKTRRTCPKGHVYFKSTDCPSCPVCENEGGKGKGFLSLLAAPARRALEKESIATLKQLSQHSQEEILGWHGIGAGSIPVLKNALKSAGLDFKKD